MNKIDKHSQLPFFKRTWEQGAPAVLLFGTSWSGTSNMVCRILRAMEQKYYKTVLFYYVDMEEMPSLTNHFGIQTIPTILSIKNRKVYPIAQGLTPAQQIERELINLFSFIKNNNTPLSQQGNVRV